MRLVNQICRNGFGSGETTMTENTHLEINEQDHLVIGGCDATALAEQYGTPLYVMDEASIRENMRMYRDAMKRHYADQGMVLYASKAFCTTAICRIAHQEGIGLDVVSGGEIQTALAAGFPMERVWFHGNNKTPQELRLALSCGVGRIVVDNLEELALLDRLAAELGRQIDISVRVKPGVDAHTHDFIKTGSIDSKFGVALENGEALVFAEKTLHMPHITLMGLHCHIGSQIFDLAPFELTAEVMLGFAAELRDRYGLVIRELNLGGGFGIKYTEEDDPVEYDRYIQSVSRVVNRVCEEKGLFRPFMLMEPGRSIVAPAGITLYRVGNVKEIKDVRTYVAVDGGMFDNPRYALYQSRYTFRLANRMRAVGNRLVTVAGKCCESGDLLGKDVPMADVKAGDLMAVLATGAYNYSMSMNYNRNTRPAVVLVRDGRHRLIVRRETHEDLLRNDLLPEDLIP
jgi:diaminopimelate decarboxylase